MVTIQTLITLKENDGLTLKNGQSICYKSGWQVATEGIATASAKEAFEAIQTYHGNCGIWYSQGIYYVDKSKRVDTKKQALEIGRSHNQISILRWRGLVLVYC